MSSKILVQPTILLKEKSRMFFSAFAADSPYMLLYVTLAATKEFTLKYAYLVMRLPMHLKTIVHLQIIRVVTIL